MKHIALSFLTFFIFMASADAASALAPVVPRVPILVYHHVRSTKGFGPATWSYKMSVSPAIFDKQMKWLVDHGYTTVSLDTAADILTGKIQGPVKPVVITFDDNNLNSYDVGVPILEKYKLTATFYIVTNRLKNKTTIDEPRVKALVQKGMDIQSHTVTHSTMTALSLKKLDQELTESKKTLEALTGKPVRHIAYPNTTQNKTVREHTKAAGYTTGTIMDPRYATSKDDLFKLPRIMMIDTTNLQKLLP